MVSNSRREYLRNYQRNWIARRRKDWFDKNGPCVICGSMEQLELDHINPEDKITHVVWSLSEGKRNLELSKCQVLCRTCHKRKTSEYNRSRLKGKPNYRDRTLRPEVVDGIRKLSRLGLTQRFIAELYGTGRRVVQRIQKNETYIER